MRNTYLISERSLRQFWANSAVKNDR